MNVRNDIIRQFIGQYPNIIYLANEDPIDLSNYPLAKTDAQSRVNACVRFKTNAGTLDKSTSIAIGSKVRSSMELFMRLFDVANTIPGKQTDYITALRFLYGINSRDEMEFFFQPVLLVRGKEITPMTFEYLETAGPVYYLDPVRGFMMAPASYATSTNNYKNIRIKHKISSVDYEAFIENNDTTSAVFSFQEIFSLIYENWNFSQEVYIYNGAVDANDSPDLDIRHSLILAYENMISFAGMYADLAHLCPPHCKIAYKLE